MSESPFGGGSLRDSGRDRRIMRYSPFTNIHDLTTHETYMQRCFQLAKLGAGNVAPNPMVGAVLVYDNTIIGEGYHQQYGQAHAEVNCINSVKEENRTLIDKSTIYVSLEPCAHYGKTPPCADLIIKHTIPNVVIGCRDSYTEVDGKGIDKLKKAGINVTTGVLEKEAKELNKRFFTFHEKKRPYIILKWAQSSDRMIANADRSRVLISNEYSNRMVHQWRSEEAGILVGTNTALYDNPSLTTRLWPGNNPVRMVIDNKLQLAATLHLFDKAVKTIIFNQVKQEEDGNLLYYKINKEENTLQQIMNALYTMKIQSVIIEGGTKLLQSFINAGFWDEARVITNKQLVIDIGVKAPILNNGFLFNQQSIVNDDIAFYDNIDHRS